MANGRLGDRWALGTPYRPFMSPRRKRRWSSIAATTVLFVVAMTAVAMADNVQVNTVNLGGGVHGFSVTRGGSVNVPVRIVATGGDGQTGCNASVAAPATVEFSGLPSGVATDSGNSFSSCGDYQNIVVSASATATLGDHAVATQTTGGCASCGYAESSFTLRVVASSPIDTTPPVITYSLDPAPPNGNSGWYVSGVFVDWTVSDSESTITSMTGCDDTTVDSDTSGVSFTCTATSAGGTSSVTTVTIRRDTTPPSVVDEGPTPATPNGSNGWYVSAVANTFSASDPSPGSGLADPTQASFSVSTGTAEGTAVSVSSGAVSDVAGNTNGGITSADFMIDLTDPTVTCNSTPSFLLNEPGAEVSATVSDLVSGPAASSATAAAETSAVGTFSANVTGFDNAGRSTTVACGYTVGYGFSGFYQPIDNGATNSAKAGQAIPVKWHLTDYYGVGVSDPVSFVSVASNGNGSCGGGSTDAIEEYTGNSGLQYLGDGYWQFNWKTPKSYAGQCRTMKLFLNGSSTPYATADFQFK